MVQLTVNKEKFKFKYLPEYADYLLKNKLTEFVTVGVRFCREENLPLLKSWADYSEEELVAMSIGHNKEILKAIATNTIADFIVENANALLTNSFGINDEKVIKAEDLTLTFFLRRKTFAYFLDGYTKNVVEQKFIIGELDVYTTQKELIAYTIYLKMYQEKLAKINAELDFHKNLLSEVQELGGA